LPDEDPVARKPDDKKPRVQKVTVKKLPAGGKLPAGATVVEISAARAGGDHCRHVILDPVHAAITQGLSP